MPRNGALFRLTSRLIARRDTLRKTLDGDLDSFRKVSEPSGVGDHVDAVIDSANHEISSQLVEIETRELGQIEHALQRIAAGAYGRCEFCGGRISATRLNALPYASSCIHCQRANESRAHLARPDTSSKKWARVLDDAIEEGEDDAPTDLDDFEMNCRESGCRPVHRLLV
jgi:DnaK suppressor protein